MATTPSPLKAKQAEEKYLADRALRWLEGVTNQRLSSLGLSLAGLLRNGKLLRTVAMVLEGGVPGRAFTKADLTDERKGFQAVLDVDYFLNICRSLDLQDHQLFSASDVTNGKEILPVCRTVRALSLSCQEKGIEAPVFETDKEKGEARRRGMTREATSGKVSALGTKLGLEEANGGGEASLRKCGPVVALLGLAAVAAAAVAFRVFGPPRTYIVKKGDTLSKVARETRGATLKSLVKKNNIKNPDVILTQQKIRL
ncbi:hypothetical protein HOP50_03g21830 [Chloropicon primus]|uniref:LysM domain-containing protein n=1 Tax=Chloropicon primus TaxID=1764295 RepID=A0A5B8MJ21_9CHLO|nr:hypothetical protein A3770_03p21830 [Chloropicon primus]UPQ98877.1 hypothetical protein HOP50_03g21830 [Chloropicon primus]|mmetsp:Transcript_2042/g.5568  ORF Transcript_2042/g.5568 Transcript_2042/m.5568 type:complete len:256 (+) Transcript_2042:178-945(+)|eukprot:QDZ19665.1 hypothetical protein A3770_03p21830 [Chloropicon primus]